VPLTDPPGDGASKCFVPAVEWCGRQRVGGVGSGSDSSARIDLGIQCESS